MAEGKFQSFEEFWPCYVKAHRSEGNRLLHFVGTTLAMGSIVAAIRYRKPRLLLAAPLLGYGCAWIGHFLLEKNKPATFGHPLWSLRGDLKMWRMMLEGTMDAEVERAIGSENSDFDGHGSVNGSAGGGTSEPDVSVN